MTRKLDRSVAALAIIATSVAGCSGSESDSAPITEPVSTEPVSTNPVATEPVSTEPVSTNPVATEPVSTEPVSTEPVATEPVSTADQAVVESVEFFEQQWKECLRTLPNCDLNEVGIGRRGQVDEQTLGTAKSFNDSDYRAANIEQLDYRVDGVVLSDGGATATATVCVTDPIALSQADGTPVDSRYLTSVQEFGLELRDGEWQFVTRTVLGEVNDTESENLCAST